MELTLSDDVGFFAVFVGLATQVRVGMVLVVATVSIAVFFYARCIRRQRRGRGASRGGSSLV